MASCQSEPRRGPPRGRGVEADPDHRRIPRRPPLTCLDRGSRPASFRRRQVVRPLETDVDAETRREAARQRDADLEREPDAPGVSGHGKKKRDRQRALGRLPAPAGAPAAALLARRDDHRREDLVVVGEQLRDAMSRPTSFVEPTPRGRPGSRCSRTGIPRGARASRGGSGGRRRSRPPVRGFPPAFAAASPAPPAARGSSGRPLRGPCDELLVRELPSERLDVLLHGQELLLELAPTPPVPAPGPVGRRPGRPCRSRRGTPRAGPPSAPRSATRAARGGRGEGVPGERVGERAPLDLQPRREAWVCGQARVPPGGS